VVDRQPTLEGPALRLRPLQADDWDALYAVASDPLIWELHPSHDRWQEPVFRSFFADALAQGGALVAIERADSATQGRIVGSSQYRFYDPANGGSVEIGWTFLDRALWGGAANRAMKRLMLEHAFRYVDRVDFLVGEDNIRSRAAMTKIGGRLSERISMDEMGGRRVRHVVFEITRESLSSGPLAGA